MATCIAITTPAGPSMEALAAKGWQKGNATDARGKPLATPFSVFGRKGGNTMIMIAPKNQGRGLCTVTARIAATDAAKSVVDGISAQLKTKPAKVEQSEIYWFAEKKVIQLASTGDRSKPSVRISVMHLPEKSK